MSDTVNTIAERICDECGLPRYPNIVSSTEATARKVLNAIKDGAKYDVFRDHDWETIKKEGTVTLLGGGVTTYALPTDFNRIVNGSMWDETNFNAVRGPVDVREWQAFNKGDSILGGLELICRIQGSTTSSTKVITFYPDTSAATVSFYYVSDKYVISSGSLLKTGVTAPDDEFIIPDDLVYLAAKWRVLRQLGMDFQDERIEYDSLLDEIATNDSGGKTIRMDRKMSYDSVNVPKTGYGG